ncbi:MAG: bifunctional ADP-heptose synthase [Saprospiraceae bacterium]
MKAETLSQYFDALPGLHIAVVGDLMIDRYVSGRVDRISPEAPVPILLHQTTEDRLGGAANVGMNIQALGAKCTLVAVCGSDNEGMILKQKLSDASLDPSGVFEDTDRRTTLKTRVLDGIHQLLRIDQEDIEDLSAAMNNRLCNFLEDLCQQDAPDWIILQDYNKGVLNDSLIKDVLAIAAKYQIPVSVDPKQKNFLAYQGATTFKPNLKEIREQLPFEVEPILEDLDKAAKFLKQKLNAKNIAITLSEKGIFVSDERDESSLIPVRSRPITDVCGAGDTVISVFSLAQAAGLSVFDAALIANEAGGIVCGFPGVMPIDKQLLQNELKTIFSA